MKEPDESKLILEMMKVQMTGRSMTGWGVGALGLLLALVLVAGLAVPACADNGPPLLPHSFAGTVTILNPPGLAAEGTLVEGFLDGEKAGETNVEAEGRYELFVRGETDDVGKTVTFRVGGTVANETANWKNGEDYEDFDLTVPGESSFPIPLPFNCFIVTAVYGTETAEEIDVLREFRDAVLMPSRLGAAFVWLYYEVSPPIAEVIARNDFLRTALRLGFIDPVVAVLDWSHRFWTEGEQ